MKDELGGKTVKVFVGLKPECYVYLMEDVRVGKKAKRTKKCVIKRYLAFDNYYVCLEKTQKILRSQQRFKSEGHDVYTEEINKTTRV